ncbi:MAG: hypothetical protein K9N51_11030 [Candidatus Pacebacteria bacterium]|nr:hypothetical protein [Candidatus Paceibacterota bacterium]
MSTFSGRGLTRNLTSRLATVLCCVLSWYASAEWSERSHWEVTRDGAGLYRAYCVLLVEPGQCVVTVSTAHEAPQDWDDWLTGGSEGAASRVTWVYDPADMHVINRYDHISGQRIPSAEASKQLVFEKTGQTVARGEGVYPPGNRLVDELLRRPKIWTGFYAKKARVEPAECPATIGLAPYAIGVDSLVDHAGMVVGDVLVKVWPWSYNDTVMDSYTNIGKAVKDRFLIGDPARVEYLQAQPDGGWKLVKKELTWPGVPGMGLQPPPKLVEFKQQWAEQNAVPERALLNLMAAQTGREADNADLFLRLQRTEATVDRYRLPCMYVAHTLPMVMPQLGVEYTDTVPVPGPDRVARQVAWLDKVYLTDGGSVSGELDPADYEGRDVTAHIDCIERVLEEAAEHSTEAFKAFSDEERDFMRDQAEHLMAGFLDSHMMCFDGNISRQRRNVRLLGLAHKLNMEALLRQARAASRIVDERFLASLKATMQKVGGTGRIAARETPWGRIVLSGTGNDRYVRKNDNCAVLVDLGGDDFYANNTGSSLPGSVPTAVLVDFEGNDRYENWHSMRQGCGFLGVGLLVDCAGDDSYVGLRCAQGTGFLGVGTLVDLAGDDRYRGIDHCQGVGQFGAGFLLDDDGNNRYEGRHACQGVGLTWGTGLLHSAGEQSDDEYFNKGKLASGYRDLGSFEGWGQGLGCGHRPYASGGLGMLLDGGGDDEYEGGTFSLGGGYYYGLGILRDRKGNDRYRGSRYNMGFTAHQAGGIFMDDTGNDRYATSHYVALGMAWDESCTVFLEGTGDDEYVAPGFALGAAAMNGYVLFKDSAGSDTYVGTKAAGKYGNHYHNGTSVGMFFDLGPGEDRHSGGRNPGDIDAGPEHAFFIDAPSVKDAIQQLRSDPLSSDDN